MRGKGQSAEFVERIPMRALAGGLRIASEGRQLGRGEGDLEKSCRFSSVEVARSWPNGERSDSSRQRRDKGNTPPSRRSRAVRRRPRTKHPLDDRRVREPLGMVHPGHLGRSMAHKWATAAPWDRTGLQGPLRAASGRWKPISAVTTHPRSRSPGNSAARFNAHDGDGSTVARRTRG